MKEAAAAAEQRLGVDAVRRQSRWMSHCLA
jgi:hypothetical protein